MANETPEQTYDKFVKSFKNIEQLLRDTNCYLFKTDLSFLNEDYVQQKYSSQVYGVYTDIGDMRYYLAESSGKRLTFSPMRPSQYLRQRMVYNDFKKDDFCWVDVFPKENEKTEFLYSEAYFDLLKPEHNRNLQDVLQAFKVYKRNRDVKHNDYILESLQDTLHDRITERGKQ